MIYRLIMYIYMYKMWKNNKTENLYESKNIDYNINEGTFYITITAIALKDCLDIWISLAMLLGDYKLIKIQFCERITNN